MKCHCLLKSISIATLMAISASPSQAGVIASQAGVIASIDSGVKPNSPGTSREIGGYDFAEDDDTPQDETYNQHGTVETLLITRDFPEAQIMPLKIVDTDIHSGDQLWTDQALMYAADQANVQVIAKTTGAVGSLEAWQYAASKNKVLVTLAGNHGKSSPDSDGQYAVGLGGKMIVVGATKSAEDTAIAEYSNRAGSQADYFVVAPGSNEFSSTKGTSFATPQVASLAMQILAQNPKLKPEKVIEIITSTAIDLGAPGVDSVYGHGLIDREAALQPIDLGSSSGSSSTGTAAIVGGALLVGGAVAYAILKSKNSGLGTTFITDKYDRGYVVDIESMSYVRQDRVNINSMLSSLEQDSNQFLLHKNDTSSSYVTTSSLNQEAYYLQSQLDTAFSLDNQEFGYNSLTFFQKNADSSHLLSFNNSVQTSFGALALGQSLAIPSMFSFSDTLSNPYMGFTNEGIGSASSFRVSNNFSFNVGLSHNDDNERFGVNSDSGVVEGVYSYKDTRLSMQIGSLRENGNLFGGASQGLLSVDRANTTSVGFAFSQKLSDNFAIMANYTEGYTQVDEYEDSFLQNFSTIRSNAFGLGLMGKSLIQKNDRIGIGFSRPLKVISGDVDVITPQGREEVGESIQYQNSNINLNPDGDEKDFEFYYSFTPYKNTQLTTYFLHQQDPYHNNDEKANSTILSTLQFKF